MTTLCESRGELPLERCILLCDTLNQAPDLNKVARDCLVKIATNTDNYHANAIKALKILDIFMKNCSLFRADMANPDDLKKLYKTLPHVVRFFLQIWPTNIYV